MTKLKTVGKSILISGIAVPTLGVLAHFMGGGSFQYNDSKLSHRFECAYSMNPKHKTFTSYQYVNKQVADAWFDSEGNPLNDVGASVPTARVEEDVRHPDYIKFCNEEEYIVAALQDFLNLHNGLFCVNLSTKHDIEIELSPTSIQDVKAEDVSYKYILPVEFTFGTIYLCFTI